MDEKDTRLLIEAQVRGTNNPLQSVKITILSAILAVSILGNAALIIALYFYRNALTACIGG